MTINVVFGLLPAKATIDVASVTENRVDTLLTTDVITERILSRGLCRTTARVPKQSIYAYLVVDIKNKGQESRFQRTAPGTFALRAWGLPEVSSRAAKSPRLELLALKLHPNLHLNRPRQRETPPMRASTRCRSSMQPNSS